MAQTSSPPCTIHGSFLEEAKVKRLLLIVFICLYSIIPGDAVGGGSKPQIVLNDPIPRPDILVDRWLGKWTHEDETGAQLFELVITSLDWDSAGFFHFDGISSLVGTRRIDRYRAEVIQAGSGYYRSDGSYTCTFITAGIHFSGTLTCDKSEPPQLTGRWNHHGDTVGYWQVVPEARIASAMAAWFSLTTSTED